MWSSMPSTTDSSGRLRPSERADLASLLRTDGRTQSLESPPRPVNLALSFHCMSPSDNGGSGGAPFQDGQMTAGVQVLGFDCTPGRGQLHSVELVSRD